MNFVKNINLTVHDIRKCDKIISTKWFYLGTFKRSFCQKQPMADYYWIKGS